MTPGPAAVAIARVELRRRWRAVVGLGLLAGILGGALVAVVAGARRTVTAYDRLVAATEFPEMVLQLVDPPEGVIDRVRADPVVVDVTDSVFGVGAHLGVEHLAFVPVASGTTLPFVPRVVAGRMFAADAVDEVVVSEHFAGQLGVGVGDVVPWHGLSHEQFMSFGDGFGEFEGPRVDLEVVGLLQLPSDVTLSELPMLVTTPAFHRRHAAALPQVHNVWVDLAHDADGRALADRVAGWMGEAGAVDDGAIPSVGVVDLHAADRFIDDAASAVVVGLATFGGVLAVAGGFVFTQSLVRHLAARDVQREDLRALGLSTHDRVLAAVLAGVPASAVAALVAVVVAVLASPIFPIGPPGEAEPDPGVVFDPVVVGIGALVVVVVTLLSWGAAARREEHRAVSESANRVRPSALAALVARWGAGVPTWVGVRMAFEPGAGRSAVPVRSAMAATALGVAGALAALVVGASMDRLLVTPTRWGQPFDVRAALTDDVREDAVSRLMAAPEVDAFAIVHGAAVDVAGISTTAYAVETRRGVFEPSVLSGRLPAGPHEIAMGPESLELSGLSVGDVVTVAGQGAPAPTELTIVGSALTFGDEGDNYSLGVLVALETLEGMAAGRVYTNALVVFVDGVDPEATAGRLLDGLELSGPAAPSDIGHLRSLRTLPQLLAAFVAALGLGGLVHAVVLVGNRRRRDLALLRCLGLRRRESRRVVVRAALATVATGCVVGVPIGLGVGNVTWSALAGVLYVAPDQLIPATVLLVAPSVIGLAFAAALLQARRCVVGPAAAALRAVE